MQRPAPQAPSRRVLVLVVLGLAGALVAVLLWQVGSSAPEQRTLNPLQKTSPGETSSPSPTRFPAAGRSRPPDARVDGRRIWVAPAPELESELAVVEGPFPESIPVAERYPALRVGHVQRALAVLGVVGDTAALDRLLVLDDSWQAFELDLAPLAAPGGPTMSRGALSPDGTRLALGMTGSYVVVNLRDLTRQRVGVGDISTRDISWANRSVVLGGTSTVREHHASSRTAELSEGITGIAGVDTEADPVSAVVVNGRDPALLVLDGDRPGACCAVVGWLGADRVLYESRYGLTLHLLVWNTRTGEVSRVSAIEPAVSNDSYLLISYAKLGQPRS